MKDEEKALDISVKLSKDKEFDCTSLELYQAAMEMAKWKEQEILEKLENFLKGINLPYYADNSHIDVDNDELIKDIKKAILGERENDNS